ncbi:ankyrin repeat domain-containing protein [Mariniblastus fucicola]|uniref:Ankyrin repeats (3 copies) n=1 Tax=Mariniblastus fucicola TaxID=980251 RepID=A0A5B9PCH0_9BACT|nr:ankyrin repeat domain-containing protein [Mariniblastus fucicola]QEG23189.1 Ankyrin repeats (3 copies) [Mariniblastus fucicola]
MTVRLTGKTGDFLKLAVSAAGRGDLKAVKSVLEQRPHWHKHVGSHGRTMLWEAAHRGKLEVVKFLADRAADINACGTHYTPYFVEVSALCISVHKKHHAVAEFLRSSGAKSNIHMAAFLGDLNSLKKFLSRSPKRLNLGHPQHKMAGKDEDGLEFVSRAAPWATPLCYALRGGDIETVKFLIEAGATIDGFDEQMFIAADDNFEMVKALLENGADKKFAPRVCPDGSELYKLVASYGVRMSKAELNEELVYLCRGDRGGDPETVRQMLQHGADVNFQDSKGKTALHRAAKAGFVETTSILLENGASVYVRDRDQETPLFDAARSTIKKTVQQLAVIDMLLQAGADVETKNRKDQLPASVARKPEVRKRLNARKAP